MGPQQVRTVRVRGVELGVIAIKGYSAFPKALGLKPHHQVVPCHTHNTRGARGVMVIVVGNGHGDTSSNPG